MNPIVVPQKKIVIGKTLRSSDISHSPSNISHITYNILLRLNANENYSQLGGGKTFLTIDAALYLLHLSKNSKVFPVSNESPQIKPAIKVKIYLNLGVLTMSEVINSEDLNLTGIAAHAQELLGQGIQASIVAQTLGVTESYISQLLSQDAFLKGVVELRYNALQKHNARDAEYDSIEDTLLERLKSTLPMLFDPMKIVKCIQVINSAKRRGSSEQGSITQHNMVVNLTLPVAITERFAITKDVNNQIIEAGEQKLVTIQSGSLMERVNRLKQNQAQNQIQENHDESTKQIGAPTSRTEIATSPRRIGAPGANPFEPSSQE